MSKLIVEMEMPKNNCEMAVEIKGVGDWCPIMAEVCDYYSTKKMPDWCPIKGVLPDEHGDLIDRTLLCADLAGVILSHRGLGIDEVIARQPAIIAAERKRR